MGLMRFFESMGNSFLAFIFKLFIILLIVLVAIMAILGIATYWQFVLGLLIGMIFSPYFYTRLEHRYKLGLPEEVFWGIPEILEGYFYNEDRVQQIRNELAEKQKAAAQRLAAMDNKLRNLEAAYQDLRTKSSIKDIMTGKKTSKYRSVRLRKALLAELGEPTWLKEISEITDEINWNEYV